MKWTWDEIKKIVDVSLNGKKSQIDAVSILGADNPIFHLTEIDGKIGIFEDEFPTQELKTPTQELKTPAQMIQEEKDKAIKDLMDIFPNIQDIADTFNKKTGLVITNISFEFIFNRTFADYFPKGIVSNVHLDIKELK